MKIIKKVHVLSTLLLLATAFNSHKTQAMEQPNPHEPPTWLVLAADAILYSADKFRDFLTYVHSYPKPLPYIYPYSEQIEQFNINLYQHQQGPFALLPEDMQQTIIFLLSERNDASTLEDAARAINSLAQVNQQLNTLINDPNFCLQIIKHLSAEFNCSNEIAAKALQTQEAKRRLEIQKKFEDVFGLFFSQEEFDKLYKQYKGYVDLNFTYHSYNEPISAQNTLLNNVAFKAKDDQAAQFKCLLDTHAIDINHRNIFGTTALIMCASECQTPEALQILCNSPHINIDLRNNTGGTALIYACGRLNKKNKNTYIKILLDAGADPEATNEAGETPLIAIEQTTADNDENKQQLLNLIKEAIQKKHEKK